MKKNNLIPKSFYIEEKITKVSFIILVILNVFLLFNTISLLDNNGNLKRLEDKKEHLTEVIKSNDLDQYRFQLRDLEREISQMETGGRFENKVDINKIFSNINKLSNDNFKLKNFALEEEKISLNIDLKDRQSLKLLRDIILKSDFDLKYEQINYNEGEINVIMKGDLR